MSLNLTVLGENIKKFRVCKGLTQQILAERLHISAQSVSKWECGQAMPELDKLCGLAEILGISLDTLLAGDNAGNQVLIGVDCGGTKTEFVLFDTAGRLLKRLVKEGANPNLCGLEKCVQLLTGSLQGLPEKDMQIAGIFVGGAGFLTGNHADKIRQALQKVFPKSKVACSSDIMNIIACGSDTRRSIAAICGTGSVVYANVDRALHRLGGGGYLLDKLGSGFDMGKEVLRTAWLERDGIGEKSAITPLVEKQLGGSVWDNVQQIYKQGTAYIASFAPIAFQAYEQGDPVAARILKENAAYLGSLISAAAKMYDCGRTVVLSGSIFMKVPAFTEMVKACVSKDLQWEIPTNPPVYGACVLACELCGVDADGLKENFGAQYPVLC